jgi:hypothetical protein
MSRGDLAVDLLVQALAVYMGQITRANERVVKAQTELDEATSTARNATINANDIADTLRNKHGVSDPVTRATALGEVWQVSP